MTPLMLLGLAAGKRYVEDEYEDWRDRKKAKKITSSLFGELNPTGLADDVVGPRIGPEMQGGLMGDAATEVQRDAFLKMAEGDIDAASELAADQASYGMPQQPMNKEQLARISLMQAQETDLGKPDAETPSALMKEAKMLFPNSPELQREWLKSHRAKSETTSFTVESEEMMDTPVKMVDLSRLRDSKGAMYPPGTTWREVKADGGRLLTNVQAGNEETNKVSKPVLDLVNRALFGEGGVDNMDGVSLFPKESELENIRQGASNWWDSITNQNPRIVLYESQKESAMAGFARQRGEVGTLTEGDIARIAKGWPVLYPFPDSDKVARAKMRAQKAYMDARTRKIPASEAEANAIADAVLEGIDLGAGSSNVPRSGSGRRKWKRK